MSKTFGQINSTNLFQWIFIAGSDNLVLIKTISLVLGFRLFH